jgi:two-component system, LytTR family, sensor kinase
MSAIINKFRLQFIYILMWIVVAIVHLLILNMGYNIKFSSALADSLVFNFAFALLGVGLWFSVKFSQLQKKNVFEILFQHLTASTIVLLIWIMVSNPLLRLLLNSDGYYLDFLDRSLTMRVFSGILFYGLLVTIYYLIASFRELQEKTEKEAQLTTMLKEAELDMLRSQIRPHFLFNSLNAISSLTISRPEQAQEMVIKLSEFMRYSLSQQGEKMSTLEKELYHIRLYLDIEQVRFSGKLSIKQNIDENGLQWKVPSMILQPLIENAVKHGVYDSEGQSEILLMTSRDQSYLKISIANSYEPSGLARKGTGTGLRNVGRRLETIYNESGLMQVINNGSNFEVSLKIPANVKT